MALLDISGILHGESAFTAARVAHIVGMANLHGPQRRLGSATTMSLTSSKRREELLASAGDSVLADWAGYRMLSIIEGEHDTRAAVLTESPAEVLATVPEDVRSTTEMRNRSGNVAWATTWLRMTPQRLLSFAELARRDAAHSS